MCLNKIYSIWIFLFLFFFHYITYCPSGIVSSCAKGCGVLWYSRLQGIRQTKVCCAWMSKETLIKRFLRLLLLQLIHAQFTMLIYFQIAFFPLSMFSLLCRILQQMLPHDNTFLVVRGSAWEKGRCMCIHILDHGLITVRTHVIDGWSASWGEGCGARINGWKWFSTRRLSVTRAHTCPWLLLLLLYQGMVSMEHKKITMHLTTGEVGWKSSGNIILSVIPDLRMIEFTLRLSPTTRRPPRILPRFTRLVFLVNGWSIWYCLTDEYISCYGHKGVYICLFLISLICSILPSNSFQSPFPMSCHPLMSICCPNSLHVPFDPK